MIVLTIKQLKRRVVQGLVEPELFYMPIKNEIEPEPMILKILVTDTENEIGISPAPSSAFSSILFSVTGFKYANMEQEYNETNKIQLDPSNYNILLKPYYNLKIKDSSKVLITDDIDYFRNSSFDCLYKSHDENISEVIYSKCCTSETIWCEIDWGDGTVENINDIIEHCENEVVSYDRIITSNQNNVKYHTYSKTGEYYIKVKGRIPCLRFLKNINSPLPILEEIVQWGNLSLYTIDGLFYSFYTANNNQLMRIKMPEHISTNSFKNVLTARNAFAYLDMTENDISQEIIFDFVNTFPNLLDAGSMFYCSNISYIPRYFCYNHKNIMNCSLMFHSNPITYIGERAFANCDNLTTVNDLTYNGTKPDGTFILPLLTRVEDGVFENDINLLDISFAFNYVHENPQLLYSDENIGLKTVGNNVYKNCKRLRHAIEPFYQQTGLVSVGESLFEGCEDLIDVNMCFWRCWSLQYIGDNIFKGCTKVRLCPGFCYEDYLVNFPDKMFYDLRYYDYLKGMTSYDDFNGFWEYIGEQNGIINDNSSLLGLFLKFKGYNHSNFPTRKHSKDLFSKEYISDCIVHGDVNWSFNSNGIFNSFIQFDNKISDNYSERYIITNFTGEAFSLWEDYNSLILYGINVFGIRNIKAKETSKNTATTIYIETINYYKNYNEIANAEPYIISVSLSGGGSYLDNCSHLLNSYTYPENYESEYTNHDVIECSDPIKYIYRE